MADPAPDPRRAALARLERRLERPMLALSLVWLALFVVEFTRGLTPALERVTWAIIEE